MIGTELDTLSRVRQETEESGLELVRATPRSEHHLLVCLADVDGTETAGQWYDDPCRTDRVVAQTAATAAPGAVRRLGAHLLLQDAGADRRLPALHRLVRDAGATLLAHRPERRGVVSQVVGGDLRYTKVVRPDRLPALVATLQAVAETSAVRVPEVLVSDPRDGSVTLAALPGRTLHDLLLDPGVPHTSLGAAAAAAGAGVRRLHHCPVTAGRPAHGADQEVRVTRDWIGRADDHGLLGLPRVSVDALADRMAALVAGTDADAVLLHRDLHDKQILVADDAGVLDLDLAAIGHPALDLANLLVHVELRVHQGLVPVERARACVEAVVAGYDPRPSVTDGLRGYGLAARLRLLGVYAFRPRSTSAALRLITCPLFEETS